MFIAMTASIEIEISTGRDLLESTSGSERDTLAFIFLRLNHLSHDIHFSRRQNMETFQVPQKNSNFYLHRFSWYLTPDDHSDFLRSRLVRDLLESTSGSERDTLAFIMRFPSHNFSKILSNPN